MAFHLGCTHGTPGAAGRAARVAQGFAAAQLAVKINAPKFGKDETQLDVPSGYVKITIENHHL